MIIIPTEGEEIHINGILIQQGEKYNVSKGDDFRYSNNEIYYNFINFGEVYMEEELNKTICKNCYGKGYSTLYRGEQIGSPDFPGDKYVKIKDAEILKIPCKVCRSKEYEEFKKKNDF